MSLYDNWHEEKRSAYLYNVMAESEQNILHKKLFIDLKKAADKQASLWEEKIKKENSKAQFVYVPSLRTRFIAWLVKTMGTENLQTILPAMKIRGMSVFADYHNEHKHTSLNSASNLRAAIFGANDGLISNMSLILGFAGASSNHQMIILAGVAGLLAGACSMAAGEYISVKSQREVFEYQIAIEKKELAEYPEEEAEELSLIYQARGIPASEADKLAKFMTDNPERGLDALAREELGLNPEDLVSPIGAMLSSFFSFSIGAFIPVLPFLFGDNRFNLTISISLTALTLFSLGALLCLFTNRPPLLLGARMLFVGAVAGFITYGIGSLIGVANL